MANLKIIVLLLTISLAAATGCGNSSKSELEDLKKQVEQISAENELMKAKEAEERAQKELEDKVSAEVEKRLAENEELEKAEAESAEKIKQEESKSRYIFPNSSTERVEGSELLSKTDVELRIARNEIFARHGYVFSDDFLRSYFASLSWYVPGTSNDSIALNDIEKYNVDLISKFEPKKEVVGSTVTNNGYTVYYYPDYYYFLPDSDKRILSAQEIASSVYYVFYPYARNEIYARHGYIFQNKEYQLYFESQPWYSRNPGFNESMLSSVEKKNVETIKSME